MRQIRAWCSRCLGVGRDGVTRKGCVRRSGGLGFAHSSGMGAAAWVFSGTCREIFCGRNPNPKEAHSVRTSRVNETSCNAKGASPRARVERREGERRLVFPSCSRLGASQRRLYALYAALPPAALWTPAPFTGE